MPCPCLYLKGLEVEVGRLLTACTGQGSPVRRMQWTAGTRQLRAGLLLAGLVVVTQRADLLPPLLDRPHVRPPRGIFHSQLA